MGGSRQARRAQFNIRIDSELLDKYRDFCRRNGLDPQGQIINFLKRLVESEYDFQDKLWEVLREGAE